MSYQILNPTQNRSLGMYANPTAANNPAPQEVLPHMEKLEREKIILWPIQIARNQPAYCDVRGDPRLRTGIHSDPIPLDQQPYCPQYDTWPTRSHATRPVFDRKFPLGRVGYYLNEDNENPYDGVLPASKPYMTTTYVDPMGGRCFHFERETKKCAVPTYQETRDTLTFRESIYDGYLRKLQKYKYLPSEPPMSIRGGAMRIG